MSVQKSLSRRRFMGGLAALTGYCGLRPELDLWGQSSATADVVERSRVPASEYDAVAKLCFNENPYGPPSSVLEAMTQALKYANRYGAPDGGILQAIASHHGVERDNVVLGAGSTEILEATAAAFLNGDRKVVGVEPTFSTVYQFATGLNAGVIRLPLGPAYRQDIAAMSKAVQENKGRVGFVYLCNPNNPTGLTVKKQEVKELLHNLPGDVPVLIDEAYHHFVEDPDYATSVPYVLQGRPVIIARTFSKIAALAGMRVGYAVAPAPLIGRLRPHLGEMHVNILAKWGAAAALKDTASQAEVRTRVVEQRKKTIGELAALGFNSLPSEANFFMVDLRRPVEPVIQEFRRRKVLVGRPFPPMVQHLRVSIGTAQEMGRFVGAFKEIVARG